MTSSLHASAFDTGPLSWVIGEIRGALERMYENHAARRPFDWTMVEALIRLDFTQSPVSQHGTHVAGILGPVR